MRLYSYRTDPFDPSKISCPHLSTIPKEHAKIVRSLAWSPSGKTLATSSFDTNIRIWEQTEASEDDDESEGWECIGFLSGHETECKIVAYTGALFATCTSRDKLVWVWEGHGDRRVQSWCLLPLTSLGFPAPLAVTPGAEFQS